MIREKILRGRVVCPYCKDGSNIDVPVDTSKRGFEFNCPKCGFVAKEYPYRKVSGRKPLKNDDNAEYVIKNQKKLK